MLKAQSHKTAPPSHANHKSQGLTCTSDQPAINQSPHNPLFGCGSFLEYLTELRETLVFTGL